MSPRPSLARCDSPPGAAPRVCSPLQEAIPTEFARRRVVHFNLHAAWSAREWEPVGKNQIDFITTRGEKGRAVLEHLFSQERVFCFSGYRAPPSGQHFIACVRSCVRACSHFLCPTTTTLPIYVVKEEEEGAGGAAVLIGSLVVGSAAAAADRGGRRRREERGRRRRKARPGGGGDIGKRHTHTTIVLQGGERRGRWYRTVVAVR